MNADKLELLYEDNHIIAVVKPVGVLSQGDGSGAPDMLSLLSDNIAGRRGKPGKAFVGLIHRLDRNVGGAMFFAKTSKGASRAGEDMRSGNFYKGYLALTHNMLPGNDEGFLRNRLKKDEKRNMVYESEDGKDCVLYYKYICSFGSADPGDVGNADEKHIYFAVPVTGRSHQIRAQFAIAEAPLIGDNKYGHRSVNGWDIGLWSSLASMRRTVDRSERIWVKSIPEGELWRTGRSFFPERAKDFILTAEAEKLLITIKNETREIFRGTDGDTE